MPPSLAAFVTGIAVLALLAWDRRASRSASAALWLPVLWLVVTASRYPTQWLSLGTPTVGLGNVAEGSPLDATYFAVLIVAGATVLLHRSIPVVSILRHNGWITAFAVYGLVAILWSDYPEIATKRWIKTLGHPIMALLILSDPSPLAAFRAVMRRCAFVLVPASVLFIKYYPQHGRGWDAFTGEAYNMGVGLSKNDLGYQCLFFGLFFLWTLIVLRHRRPRVEREEFWISVAMLVAVAWLVRVADSATSLASLVVGSLVLVVVGLRLVHRRHVVLYCIAVIAILGVVEAAFDVSHAIIRSLGRDPTLTDRVYVWQDVIRLQPDALVGAGFESFWLGWRLDALWHRWPWQPIQAHNGYIETYLNLGWIGVLLLAGMLVTTVIRIDKLMQSHFDWGLLCLAFLAAILLFNVTEAGFKGVHFAWTMFHVIALRYPARRAIPTRTTTRPQRVAPPSRRVGMTSGFR